MILFKHSGGVATSFIELDWDSRVTYEAETGTTERGYLYEKYKWERRVYNIIISADAILTDSHLDYLEAFWHGYDRQISFNGTDWIKVVPKPGPFPKTRLENSRRFNEVAFELYRVDPVGTRINGEELIP